MMKRSRLFRFVLHVLLLWPAVSFVPPNLAAAAVVDSSLGPTDDPQMTLFNETIPMLWASRLVYTFSSLVKQTRAGNLEVPQETLDILNNTDRSSLFPQSFRSINSLIKQNWDALTKLAKDPNNDGSLSDYDDELLEQLKRVEKKTPNDDTIWMEGFDSLYQKTECVYGIVRDDNEKRIIVTFRGSVAKGTKDWARNFQVKMTNMRLPKKLKAIMKERTGNDKEYIPVHGGFYAYLFDNDQKVSGEQKFDKIRDKLKKLFTHPDYKDYKLYVSGHSLGAALSSMVAFKLAGSKKEWIPKPVTCISFESPRNGGVEFRDAFQVLEQEGLIRYLRVSIQEDVVPAIPPFSLRLKVWHQKLYKHVGLQLNLLNKDYKFVYPRNDNRISRVIGNNFVTKRAWNVNKYHGLQLVNDRLDEHVDVFGTTYIDEVYRNTSIVGDLFSGERKDEL